MPTYSGDAGIKALQNKIAARSKALLQISAISIAHRMIDESPVGQDFYPPDVENSPGDFKNSWSVGVGVSNRETRNADPSGGGAYTDAIRDASRVNIRLPVFITNSIPYAGNVEDGWEGSDPFRMQRGWGDRDGYRVVAKNINQVKELLIKAANQASRVNSENDIF